MAISFTKVALPYGYLGNMSPFGILYREKTYRTAEHLFQALRFDDFKIIDQIIAAKSPMSAKMIAKKNAQSMIVVPRSNQDIKNMLTTVSLKFGQHQELMDKLLETGEQEIIENCTNRPNESGLFWGMAIIDGTWQGKNVLGKILMTVRNQRYNQK